METKKKILLQTAGGVILGLVIFYVLFNWTMSAVIHSRKEVAVPDLKGKSIDAALSMVSPLNLGLKKEDEEFDQNVPAGTIIRQHPFPGMTVREGKIVKVTVSQGGKVTFVPDLSEQPVRTAEIAIRSSGLSLGEETFRFSVAVEKGHVVSQDPPAGNIAGKDSLVNLVISAGNPPEGTLLVPKFSGKSADDARRWAEKNNVELVLQEEAASPSLAGTVLRQEPLPDSDVSHSRKVTVIVASSLENAEFPQQKFYYEIPQGEEERQIRLVLIDENGEKELFQGSRAPGSKLEISIAPRGSARVRVFINNILVEEREVK